ncbi:MAG: allantoinase AllB [Bacteroidetes bacterium]|nr:allantoinase AllB [Bacteroidota bacterium]
MHDVAIYSRRVILPKEVVEATIFIQEGKIIEIRKGSLTHPIKNLVDAGNHVVMPGIIDPHVHINEPGRTEWEGFETGTLAALNGGITCIADMPLNSSPVTTTVKALKEKIESTKNKLHAKCFFWGGIVPGNEEEIEPLINAGVRGFKAFLTHSGIDDFPNVTEEDLRKAMPIIAQHHLPLLVHCELESNFDFKSGNPRSYNNYLQSRPDKWEHDAIKLMIKLCKEFNCKVHIVHLSSAQSLPLVAEAKSQNLPLTCETAPHYLYFNAENIKDGHTLFKCAPPIRNQKNIDSLWEALQSGLIDFIATDHSPCLPSMKNMETGNFMTAWGGISSLQFSLPVVWTAGRQHQATLNDICHWLCEEPAKLLRLENKNGKIETGFDADLVIWNPEEEFKITKDIIKHRHKETPYLNETLNGVIKEVYIGGQKKF